LTMKFTRCTRLPAVTRVIPRLLPGPAPVSRQTPPDFYLGTLFYSPCSFTQSIQLSKIRAAQ